jgi:hypothetical protein
MLIVKAFIASNFATKMGWISFKVIIKHSKMEHASYIAKVVSNLKMDFVVNSLNSFKKLEVLVRKIMEYFKVLVSFPLMEEVMKYFKVLLNFPLVEEVMEYF